MAASICTWFLLLIVLVSINAEPSYKICAKRRDEMDCSQLDRSKVVACNIKLHGIDCLHNVQQGRTDFGRVRPQEALIAANFLQDVVVIGEIRSELINDDSVFATVVLVKQEYGGGFLNLRGKKYCHPGFKYEDSVSELLLKQFEKHVLKTNNVDICSSAVNSDTLAEKELKAVHDFFGSTCRPGPWSEADYNNDFYDRYSRLCDLCNNGKENKEKCTIPNGVAPFMYSLECLLRLDGGEVALTTLNTVKEYFDKYENRDKKVAYKYLCSDGSVKPLDTPCVWSKQPWDLIIANKKQAAEIKSSLQYKWLSSNFIELPNNTSGVVSPPISVIADLEHLLFPERGLNKMYPVNEVPLEAYLKDYRLIPNIKDSTLCGQDIKWCTISNAEHEKCLWLALASLDRAIQPVINCVRSSTKITCLEDIQNNRADVVTSDAHYGYLARKKGLAPIAYPDTDQNYIMHILLVIKEKDAGNIQTFQNLKGKKSCFPEYAGIEWISFINAGRSHRVLSETTCNYGGLISEFVGDSCIPGAHDPVHEISSATDKEKLCRLCLPINTGTAVTCNTDNSNQYYGNIGALKCLKEVGDFAVITKGDYSNITPSEFRVLCQNGTLASNTGFNVDPGCALLVTVDSEVVTKRKQPNKNKDIELALFEFERRFGIDRSKPFEVFNTFNNTLDLLFKDSTPGLVKTNAENVYVKNYINAFAHTDKCLEERTPEEPGEKKPDDGAASALQTPILTTLVMLIISKFLF